MTKREHEQRQFITDQLLRLGFQDYEIRRLRRASRTLTRWFELECGDSNEYGSWAIERDGADIPYRVHHSHRPPFNTTRFRIPDRERGARRAIDKIVENRNTRHYTQNTDYYGIRRDELTTYIMTDPRGCALHILRPGDVPEGKDPSAYYTNGIAVW